MTTNQQCYTQKHNMSGLGPVSHIPVSQKPHISNNTAKQTPERLRPSRRALSISQCLLNQINSSHERQIMNKAGTHGSSSRKSFALACSWYLLANKTVVIQSLLGMLASQPAPILSFPEMHPTSDSGGFFLLRSSKQRSVSIPYILMASDLHSTSPFHAKSDSSDSSIGAGHVCTARDAPPSTYSLRKAYSMVSHQK